MVSVPPKGFKAISVTTKQYAKLTRMKRAKRLDSITECIDELLKFCVY